MKTFQDNIVGEIAVLRVELVSGYMSDPVMWRRGSGKDVWQNLNIDPLYPLATRPDVVARGMRSESLDDLVRHLQAPRDRLPEDMRQREPAEIIATHYTNRSIVY